MNQQRTIYDGAASFGASRAKLCIEPYAALIHSRTNEFCRQVDSPTEPTYDTLFAQSQRLTVIINSIANSSRAAKLHPNVASQIWQVTKSFSDSTTLMDDPVSASMKLTEELTNLQFLDPLT